MTKNKSLFSGVGDGNRVKSIRLQGDKHTQGKKGKRTVSPDSWSKPRAPPSAGWQLQPGPQIRLVAEEPRVPGSLVKWQLQQNCSLGNSPAGASWDHGCRGVEVSHNLT